LSGSYPHRRRRARRPAFGNSSSPTSVTRTCAAPMRPPCKNSSPGASSTASRRSPRCSRCMSAHEKLAQTLPILFEVCAHGQKDTFSGPFHALQGAVRKRPCKVFGPNRTKMFHVKRFCPIEPRNRTNLMDHVREICRATGASLLRKARFHAFSRAEPCLLSILARKRSSRI
jgi:hypothetical protein